jgi:hypothetical protein
MDLGYKPKCVLGAHGEEVLEITAEAVDDPVAYGEEREHFIGAVATMVQVPVFLFSI